MVMNCLRSNHCKCDPISMETNFKKIYNCICVVYHHKRLVREQMNIIQNVAAPLHSLIRSDYTLISQQPIAPTVSKLKTLQCKT